MLKAILALLTALPEILRLINKLEEQHKKDGVNKRVKDDIKKINDAFASGDSSALDRIFRGDS